MPISFNSPPPLSLPLSFSPSPSSFSCSWVGGNRHILIICIIQSESALKFPSYCKKKDPLIPHEKMFKAHKILWNRCTLSLDLPFFSFLFFSLSPSLCSCIGNRLPHVLLILFAFSILPSQKLAPRCANPHFKARCLSAGNKAHRTYYGILSFPPHIKRQYQQHRGLPLPPPKERPATQIQHGFLNARGSFIPF